MTKTQSFKDECKIIQLLASEEKSTRDLGLIELLRVNTAKDAVEYIFRSDITKELHPNLIGCTGYDSLIINQFNFNIHFSIGDNWKVYPNTDRRESNIVYDGSIGYNGKFISFYDLPNGKDYEIAKRYLVWFFAEIKKDLKL